MRIEVFPFDGRLPRWVRQFRSGHLVFISAVGCLLIIAALVLVLALVDSLDRKGDAYPREEPSTTDIATAPTAVQTDRRDRR